ncbi:hypothetical protein LTS18_008591, partial [Coniosporium uncinatum]
KIEGEEDDDIPPPQPPRGGYQRQNFGPSQSEQLYGIRKSSEARRSVERDRERYDSDPRVLGDDFTQLELRDDEGTPDPLRQGGMRKAREGSPYTSASPSQRRGGNRPLANPDLFKPTPVAPQSGPVDEVDALYRQPTPVNRQPSPGVGKSGKKWQPLTSVAPNPENDDDPFSLGDSDDEETKEAKKTDLKAEDTARLKKAASATVEDDKEGDDGPPKLKPQESERSGSVSQTNKEAEELLKNA